MEQKTYKRIGECMVDEEGEIIELKKEYFRQGWIFKDPYAFYHEPKKPCYVPEEAEDYYYTQDNFMGLCNDQEEIAEMILKVWAGNTRRLF